MRGLGQRFLLRSRRASAAHAAEERGGHLLFFCQNFRLIFNRRSRRCRTGCSWQGRPCRWGRAGGDGSRGRTGPGPCPCSSRRGGGDRCRGRRDRRRRRGLDLLAPHLLHSSGPDQLIALRSGYGQIGLLIADSRTQGRGPGTVGGAIMLPGPADPAPRGPGSMLRALEATTGSAGSS